MPFAELAALGYRIDHRMTTLAQTPLFDWHASHGGRMVDFAGWSMPVQYSSIVTEHDATRTAVGLFDVSHMARFRFEGPSADAAETTEFFEGLLTRRVADMQPGQIRYSLVTNDVGYALDDVLLYLLADSSGRRFHVLVVNASNREKIAAWIRKRLPPALRIKFTDLTTTTGMIAVQGPRAIELAAPLVEHDLSAMKYYTGAVTKVADHEAIVSRTGYTGEDGCELILPAAATRSVWETLLDRGTQLGAIAAGLGARDTLRLEAAMPLYGHELSEEIDPLEAGLSFAVQLDGRRFPGRDVIASRKNELKRRRIGLELGGKRAARQGHAILQGGEVVGEVTSGTFSPTLQKPIAMGFVRPEAAPVGTELTIDIRGQHEPARVVTLPFYRRP
jgi:aminomethyltransferase